MCGSAGLATVEKGKFLFEEAVTRLAEWGDEFHARHYPARKDHHGRPPGSRMCRGRKEGGG